MSKLHPGVRGRTIAAKRRVRELMMIAKGVVSTDHPVMAHIIPIRRCNLACKYCNEFDDFSKPIALDTMKARIDQLARLGTNIVTLSGGEPLLHKELRQIVKGIIDRKKFVYLCTNALLMEKRMKDYTPSPYFVWSVHLDGDKETHDRSVCQEGTYERAVAAIKEAKARGFRCNINCTLFNNADPERMANFFDSVMEMGVDGITVSPGYAYERAPDQQHFLNRQTTKQIFRDIFKRGNGGKKWSFSQSDLFLDFLAGNQTYHCTPWGNPTRTVFGWQRPCYLVGEGYAKTFKELMEGTDWDSYGVGHYEKCADCMVHSGFEATAVNDSISHPLKLFKLRKGVRTDGAMAPEVDMSNQRPAQYVFSRHVQEKLSEIREEKARAKEAPQPMEAAE